MLNGVIGFILGFIVCALIRSPKTVSLPSGTLPEAPPATTPPPKQPAVPPPPPQIIVVETR